MTSLRGLDPYVAAERALAPLFAQRPPAALALCRVLHETVPTYTWVGLVRLTTAEGRVLAQQGIPQRAITLPAGCATLLAGIGTLVVPDVLGMAPYRDCFPGARALIAIPLGPGMALVVASEHQGAFGLADRELLALVARHWPRTTTNMRE